MNINGIDFNTYFNNYPDKNGYFGKYGGVYIDEKLKAAMAEITEAYYSICQSRKFIAELRRIRKEFQGRPTPVTHLERLSDALGGKVQLYAKREDLNHSGAHKLNHCMGEALLAKYMGKKKVIAETGAGQHGVALATAAAYFGLECDIYMGSVDIKKQAPNVARMKILGANVVEVKHGLATLKEAVDAGPAALRVASDVVVSLKHVEGLGVIDRLGGGLLMDIARQEVLDDAQKNVEQLQIQLQRFNKELADVKVRDNLTVGMGRLLKFTDTYFENLVTVETPLDRLKESSRQVDETRDLILGMLRQLQTRLEEVRHRQVTMEAELNRLIVTTEL